MQVKRSHNAALRAAMVAAALTAPAPLLSQAITPLALRRVEITFRTRVSNGPDFTGRVSAATAEFRGTDLANVQGTVEFRVADMRTGIGARDSHLRGTLKADSFPTIRFELVGVDPRPADGDTIPLTYQGHLTIHGVTRAVRVPGTAALRPGAAEIQAAFPVDMREFGVEPPVRLIARVQPVVDIVVRMAFGQE